MNNSKSLGKRLLHLFPISVVKEYFTKKGVSETVLDEITTENNLSVIKTFVKANSLHTRQNVYIYQLDSVFPHDVFQADGIDIEVLNISSANGELTVVCLPKTKFKVLIGRTGNEIDLHFLYPVTIRVLNDVLIIHFTKLVRNLNSYFPEEDFPIKKGQEDNEETVLTKIVEYFGNYSPQRLDINAGVKHLWNIDDVDCYKVLSRKNASAVMETMDGTLMFKKQYPGEYDSIIGRPLDKTVFKYLNEDDHLCDEFTTEPSYGKISVNQFPANINQVKNVIAKILANN